MAKILALFHPRTGFLLAVTAAPMRTHEMSGIDPTHESMRPGDMLLGDRGLSSYVHLALLSLRQAHGVFRLHQKQLVDFTPNRPFAVGKATAGWPRSRWVGTLGPHHQLVERSHPRSRPRWMTAERHAALPE